MAALRHLLFLLLPMIHQQIGGPPKAEKGASTKETIKERVAQKGARKEKIKAKTPATRR